jgi:hypothetical protein
VELYSEDQIAEWDQADALSSEDRLKPPEDAAGGLMRRVVRFFLNASVLFTAAHNPNGKAAFVIWLGS